MAKMTISISDTLYERIGNHKNVVWSHVAAAAFETKLAELAREKEIKDMNDVLERMRAADSEQNNEDYKFGHTLGMEWAEQEASPKDLRRLITLDNDRWNRMGVSYPNAMLRLCEIIAVLEPSFDYSEQREWVERVIHEDAEKWSDDEGLQVGQGFIDGAIEVWNKVKDKL